MGEEGLSSIADAFAEAKQDGAPDDSGGAQSGSMVNGDAFATLETEHPTEPTLDGQKQDLVNELLPHETEGDGTPPDPGSNEFWGQTVEVQTVNGTQQVPLGQLRDGFMRQADYTRKTQQVAQLRKQLGDAADFLDQYRSDPQAFARAIAVEQGLIYQGDKPVAEVQAIKPPTPAEVDQMVEQLAAERIQSDPTVRQAQVLQAQSVVHQEFDRLEQVHHVKLPPELRESITQEAIQRDVADFDLLLRARLASVQDQRRQTGQLQGAAPSRPGSSPGGAQQAPGQGPEINTILEAWQQASLEQSRLT